VQQSFLTPIVLAINMYARLQSCRITVLRMMRRCVRLIRELVLVPPTICSPVTSEANLLYITNQINCVNCTDNHLIILCCLFTVNRLADHKQNTIPDNSVVLSYYGFIIIVIL